MTYRACRMVLVVPATIVAAGGFHAQSMASNGAEGGCTPDAPLAGHDI